MSFVRCALARKQIPLAQSQWIKTMKSDRKIICCANLVVAVSLLSCVGCGGRFDSGVTGVVTLDGKVVPCGTISFQPKAGGPAAYARIDADGNYIVRTGREEGLPSGEYYVTVSANEPPTVAQTAQGGPPPPGKPITPAWYRMRDTSGLSFVVESGNNEINLELTSTPPPGWNPRRRT
jgi:hypothetical protein